MERNRRWEEGFSLIEVIVAVAILAILSVPILLYFTDSAVRSANGRHEQAADLAAQTIVEELESIDGFDNIETTLVSSGRGWSAPGADEIGTISEGATKMHRPIVVDGTEYYADVTIDYTAYTGMSADPSSPLKAQYNSYDNPHFQDLYSDSSVVISEKSDSYEIALTDLFSDINGFPPVTGDDTESTSSITASMDTIRDDARRTFKLVVSDYSDEIYFVKGSYLYTATVNGKSGEYEVVVQSEQIEKDKLKNIFILFQPNYGKNVETYGDGVKQDVYIDLSGMLEDNGVNKANDLSISFIRQNTYSTGEGGAKILNANKPFTLDVSGLNYGSAAFYSNEGVTLYSGGGGLGSGGLMAKSQDRRIAAVTVKIFRSEDGSPTGGELATSTTTMSV